MRAQQRLDALIRKYQRRAGCGEIVADLQRVRRAIYGRRLQSYNANRRLFECSATTRKT